MGGEGGADLIWSTTNLSLLLLSHQLLCRWLSPCHITQLKHTGNVSHGSSNHLPYSLILSTMGLTLWGTPPNIHSSAGTRTPSSLNLQQSTCSNDLFTLRVLLEIPNDAYMLLSLILIGCSILSQKRWKLVGWYLKIITLESSVIMRIVISK